MSPSDVIELTRALVAIDSVNPSLVPGAELQVVPGQGRDAAAVLVDSEHHRAGAAGVENLQCSNVLG